MENVHAGWRRKLMKYIADTVDFQLEEPTVVTLGKFDGRHRGHQKLLHTMEELKETLGYATAIFTFSTAPLSLVTGEAATVITTSEERRHNMEKMGIDYLVEYPFTDDVRKMDPSVFVKDILVKRMRAKAMVVGPDCSFGYKGAGNVELLRSLSKELGFELYVIQKEKDHRRDISSTYIREDVVEETKEHTNDTDKKADSSQLEKAPNKVTKDPEEVSNRIYKKNKWYVNFAIILLLIIGGYMLYTYKLKDMYVEYLLSKIEFTTSQVKGICPLTVTFSYHIPASLFEDITVMYEEANGDISERKLNENIDKINATYIYEGEAFCHLKYKDRIIKTIPVECRKTGWSVFVREERKKIFRVFPMEQAYNDSGYVSLPIENVPQEAHTNHMFVSYVFYKEKLIDGDNFIYEARVRNSKQENAVPCSDIIMYIHSDTAMHGFAMNENGYAYIKFISGENTIKGDEYNLSRFNFNSSEWHVMTIKVVNKKTTFYVDGEEVLGMDYKEPLGYANELTLRFKGCGAVDYVKVSNLDGKVVYEENFDPDKRK